MVKVTHMMHILNLLQLALTVLLALKSKKKYSRRASGLGVTFVAVSRFLCNTKVLDNKYHSKGQTVSILDNLSRARP